MCLNALLNPDNSSIVSRIDATDEADEDRCLVFGRGTSKKAPERVWLRLRQAADAGDRDVDTDGVRGGCSSESLDEVDE
jgi:hypothetical protein